jgi:hypothetical protein
MLNGIDFHYIPPLYIGSIAQLKLIELLCVLKSNDTSNIKVNKTLAFMNLN